MMDKEESINFNYTKKEKAIKMLQEEKNEKQSIANYKDVLRELNIMEFKE